MDIYVKKERETKMIMTVDIGGTKTMWSLWEDDMLVETGREETESIEDFGDFLETQMQGKEIDAISFALAGPVRDHKLELTNTGQIIDLQEIQKRFAHIPTMVFLNDLEALAWSVDHLKGNQINIFRHGKGGVSEVGESGTTPREGAKAIVSLGTGLGIAAVTREGCVMPSEGGHLDFAPRSPKQHKLLERLEEKYGGHVSYERLLSGQGLANIYEVLSGEPRITPAEVSQKAAAGDAAALECFDVFTEILGAACGNYALVYMSSGGVYLGGGMAPKILPFMNMDIFESAFTDKGRFNDYLEGLPVYMIMDEAAPSIGAAAAIKAHRG